MRRRSERARHPAVAASLAGLSAVSNRERRRAAERVAAVGADVVPDLQSLARSHANAYARAGALEALAGIAERAARDACVRALRDRAMLVRLHAMLLLSRRLWAPSVATHVERLLRDPSGGVRINAVDALAERRVRSAAPALARRLTDDKWYVRQHAARALGALRARSARRPLERALGDRRAAVRAAAREALSHIGWPNTLV